MSKITIDLPQIKGNEETFSTASILAGGKALIVKNNNRFAQNDYVVVGKPGVEDTEITKISSVAGNTTVNVAALKFPHPSKTLITYIPYNQVKIYRASSQTGTYTLIDTIDLDVDSPEGTSFNDSGGDSTSWYKIVYYNETTEAESDESEPVPATGFTIYMLRSMVDDVLTLINDTDNKYITRDTVKDKINHHQNMWWISPYKKRGLKETTILTTTAGQNYVALPADFDKLDTEYSVNYKYEDETTSTEEIGYLDVLNKAAFQTKYADLTEDDSDDLLDCYVDTVNNRLYLGPTPVSADLEITIDYWAKPTALDSDVDTTVCPVPRIITYGVAAEIEASRGNDNKALAYQRLRSELILGDIRYAETRTGPIRMKFPPRRGRARYR